MNKEWLMIAAMGLGGVLFAIGGTGFKPARRFILPFLLGVLTFLGGAVWWKSLVLWVGLTGSFCLPYGSKTPYWLKCIVAITFILPTLVLGFTIWQLITPIIFILLFMLSNWKLTSNEFVWKICEFITGSLIGVTVAKLL